YCAFLHNRAGPEPNRRMHHRTGVHTSFIISSSALQQLRRPRKRQLRIVANQQWLPRRSPRKLSSNHRTRPRLQSPRKIFLILHENEVVRRSRRKTRHPAHFHPSIAFQTSSESRSHLL